jgi:hypothetical protein
LFNLSPRLSKGNFVTQLNRTKDRQKYGVKTRRLKAVEFWCSLKTDAISQGDREPSVARRGGFAFCRRRAVSLVDEAHYALSWEASH